MILFPREEKEFRFYFFDKTYDDEIVERKCEIITPKYIVESVVKELDWQEEYSGETIQITNHNGHCSINQTWYIIKTLPKKLRKAVKRRINFQFQQEKK